MPKTWKRIPAWSLLLAAVLAGCSLPLPSDEDDAIARGAVDQLRKGDLPGLLAHSGPEMKTLEAQANYGPMRAMFPAGEPISVKRIAWRSNANLGQPPMLTLDESYDYPDRTVTAAVTMSEAGGPHRWLIRGIHVNMSMKAPGAAPAPAPAAPRALPSSPAPRPAGGQVS